MATKPKYVSEWKSKGLSDESIIPPTASDNSLNPLIDYVGYEMSLKFNGRCLKQAKVTYTHGKAVNIFIIYELAGSSFHTDAINTDAFHALQNCLFGAVTLTKKADIDD